MCKDCWYDRLMHFVCSGVALLSIKALLNDPTDVFANWNESDADPCSWNGVSCQIQTKRVRML